MTRGDAGSSQRDHLDARGRAASGRSSVVGRIGCFGDGEKRVADERRVANAADAGDESRRVRARGAERPLVVVGRPVVFRGAALVVALVVALVTALVTLASGALLPGGGGVEPEPVVARGRGGARETDEEDGARVLRLSRRGVHGRGERGVRVDVVSEGGVDARRERAPEERVLALEPSRREEVVRRGDDRVGGGEAVVERGGAVGARRGDREPALEVGLDLRDERLGLALVPGDVRADDLEAAGEELGGAAKIGAEIRARSRAAQGTHHHRRPGGESAGADEPTRGAPVRGVDVRGVRRETRRDRRRDSERHRGAGGADAARTRVREGGAQNARRPTRQQEVVAIVEAKVARRVDRSRSSVRS